MTLTYYILLNFLLINWTLQPIRKDVAGTYIAVTSSTPMKFQKKIVLSCDYIVTTYFRGDMLNDSLTGRWAIVSDTLRIKLNPVVNDEGRAIFPHWDENMDFLITKNKLIRIIPQTELIKGLDTKVLKKLNRQMRKQALVMTEKENCK